MGTAPTPHTSKVEFDRPEINRRPSGEKSVEWTAPDEPTVAPRSRLAFHRSSFTPQWLPAMDANAA
jgi:hypothetical protein